MYYYKCKRCNHVTKQKIDMQRHLVKYKKCKIIENNNLSDEELYNKSLEKHEIMNKIMEDNKRIECIKCKKTFYSKSNLNKHMKNTCKDSYINIQNIGVQNICVQNIININGKYIKGFDEEWDVSQIDNHKKGEILLSNSKFSKTLENILNNDTNLNVILEDDDIGIVYTSDKNKYLPMKCKDIIDSSMKKIYKHLKDFYDEIINNNVNDLSELSLKNELMELEKKYSKFFTTEEAKNIVNKSFLSIYNNNKDKSESIYHELVKTNSNTEIEEY